MSLKSRSWTSGGLNRKVPDSRYNLPIEETLTLLEALDHFYITKQYQETGSCCVCKKISVKRCSGCKAYYCSSECQNADWQKHKLTCNKNDDRSRSSSSSQTSIKSPPRGKFSKNEEDLMMSSGSPFTALTNQLNRRSGGSSIHNSRASITGKMTNKGLNGKEKGRQSGSRIFNNKKSFAEQKYSDEKRDTSKFNGSANNDKENFSSKTPKSVENCIGSVGDIDLNLTEIKKKEVVGLHRESPDRYWVMELSHVSKYEEIQTTLANQCDSYESVPPKVGLICGCTFADEWFRGQVLTVTPKTTVGFIDYGNVSDYEFDTVKKLPETLISIPGLAFLIEFEKDTPNEYRTEDLDSLELKIEETRKTPDGVPCVQIIEGPFERTVIFDQPDPVAGKPAGVNDRRSVMEGVTKGSKGLLLLLPGESRTRFGSIVPEENPSAGACIEKVLHLSPSDSPIEGKEGDTVQVFDEHQNLQRGKVLSKTGSSYLVQLIDCGNIISVDHVYSLPDDLVHLIELGVKITLEDDRLEEKLKNVESCFFCITGEAVSEKWPCILKGEKEHELIGHVLLEKPPPGNIDTKSRISYLRSGSTVEITAFCAFNVLYIRSVDAETEQKFLDMNTEMIEFASKAKSLPFPPDPDVLCCAKFKEDGCFYRAIVTAIGSSKVTVLFVDFGNEQETDMRDIKPIPNSLKDIPFFAVKVSLSNVSAKPWSSLVKEYLKKLVTENVELVLMYNGSINEGVTLREKRTGVIVNEFMENATEEKAKDVFPLKSAPRSFRKNGFFLNPDLKYTTVPCGTDCVLAFLYVSEEEFKAAGTFWATIPGTKNFEYVNGELTRAMAEYCSTVSEPHRPKPRELCLGEFEGFWYRAISLSDVGDLHKIFFIDFGNVCELPPESIRRMKPEFVEAPALAMNCALNAELEGKFKGKPELTKKVFNFLLERVNTFLEGVRVTEIENNIFYLKFKEIEAILSG